MSPCADLGLVRVLADDALLGVGVGQARDLQLRFAQVWGPLDEHLDGHLPPPGVDEGRSRSFARLSRSSCRLGDDVGIGMHQTDGRYMLHHRVAGNVLPPVALTSL